MLSDKLSQTSTCRDLQSTDLNRPVLGLLQNTTGLTLPTMPRYGDIRNERSTARLKDSSVNERQFVQLQEDVACQRFDIRNEHDERSVVFLKDDCSVIDRQFVRPQQDMTCQRQAFSDFQKPASSVIDTSDARLHNYMEVRYDAGMQDFFEKEPSQIYKFQDGMTSDLPITATQDPVISGCPASGMIDSLWYQQTVGRQEGINDRQKVGIPENKRFVPLVAIQKDFSGRSMVRQHDGESDRPIWMPSDSYDAQADGIRKRKMFNSFSQMHKNVSYQPTGKMHEVLHEYLPDSMPYEVTMRRREEMHDQALARLPNGMYDRPIAKKHDDQPGVRLSESSHDESSTRIQEGMHHQQGTSRSREGINDQLPAGLQKSIHDQQITRPQEYQPRGRLSKGLNNGSARMQEGMHNQTTCRRSYGIDDQPISRLSEDMHDQSRVRMVEDKYFERGNGDRPVTRMLDDMICYENTRNSNEQRRPFSQVSYRSVPNTDQDYISVMCSDGRGDEILSKDRSLRTESDIVSDRSHVLMVQKQVFNN